MYGRRALTHRARRPAGAGSAAGLWLAILLVLATPAVPAREPETLAIELAGGRAERFGVELARTARERARGLMHRRALAPRTGMLFDFGPPQPVAMWMSNTYIALDMFFIARDGRIAWIHENAVPHSRELIMAPMPVVAVLELAGGTARALGIRPGDRVRHRFFDAGAISAPADRR
ncbi:MAG: DUF192 domain-containing protein [Gammaproteobacteria bacterium]